MLTHDVLLHHILGNASGCHSGTHQVVVVGCPVERGAVTSEVSGITFGVGGGVCKEDWSTGATLRRGWQSRKRAGNEVDSPHSWYTLDYMHICIAPMMKVLHVYACPHYCTANPQLSATIQIHSRGTVPNVSVH